MIPPATNRHTAAVTTPHNTDFHHTLVPMPIEVNGSFSTKCTNSKSPTAQARISDSRSTSEATTESGTIRLTISRIGTITNRQNSTAAHVRPALVGF